MSSRDDLAGAGWTCQSAGRFKAFVPHRRPLSWLDPRTLCDVRAPELTPLKSR